MAGRTSKRLNRFECHVLDTVRRRRLLERRDSVLVAFSGGPDSTALLRVLVALRPEMDLRLHAAHVVHGVHGEARAHAEHCARVAGVFGVPFSTEAVDARGRATSEGVSLEHGARLARYEVLESLADARGSQWIATGHSADDRAESVLVNLIRGTGPRGLCGVPPQRGRIIRPLIDVTRAEIVRYLRHCGLDWVEDPTNLEDNALRNRIRRYLLPEMERIAGRPVGRSLARLADAVEWDRQALAASEEILLQQCRLAVDGPGAVELSVENLVAMGDGAASLALRAAAEEVLGPGQALTLAQVREVLELLRSRTGRGKQSVGGCLFVRDRGKLTLCRSERPSQAGE